MSGCVVQVWFEEEDVEPGQRARFHILETEYPDYEAFLEAVHADDLICASRLDTHWSPGERGVRIIHRRVPMAFRGRAHLRSELPVWKIIEEVE